MAAIIKLVFLIILSFIFFWTDYIGNPCLKEKWEAIPVIFFHHFIYAFVFIGWIFDSPFVLFLYLAAPIVIFTQHYVYKVCIVTDVTNQICGTPGTIFQDPLTVAGLKPPLNMIVFSPFIILGLIIAVCKLYKIIKTRKAPILNKRCGGCSFECLLPSIKTMPP